MLLGTVIAAASLVASSVASARSGYFREPPEQSSELTVRGTQGYEISIGRSAGHVMLIASKQRTSVSYYVRAERAPADEIKARFPGLGSVSLRFHPLGKEKRWPPFCKGRAAIEQRGIFRGLIRFRGERGFTLITARHARGDTYRSFGEVCKRSEVHHGGAVPGYDLTAVAKEHKKTVFFTAFRSTTEKSFTYGEAIFSALTWEKRRGMSIMRTVFLTAPASTFAVEGPDTEPTAATVAPPSPFAGTAGFHGAAGAPGEWQGTLAIDLPGAGTVPLAGPSFESKLCLNKRCVGRLGT